MEDTTVQLFRKYLVFDEKTGEVDASAVLSVDCYMDWLRTKRMVPKKPAEAFRKAITGHARGDNGLHPFDEDMEAAIVKVLRVKRVWPCFDGTNIKIGLRGFQTEGYWERNRRVGEPSKRKRIEKESAVSKPVKKTRLVTNYTELTDEECSDILDMDFGPFLEEGEGLLFKPSSSFPDLSLFKQPSFLFNYSALLL